MPKYNVLPPDYGLLGGKTLDYLAEQRQGGGGGLRSDPDGVSKKNILLPLINRAVELNSGVVRL